MVSRSPSGKSLRARAGAAAMRQIRSFTTVWPEYLITLSTVVGLLIVVFEPKEQKYPAMVAAGLLVVGLIFKGRRKKSYWDLRQQVDELESKEGDRQAAFQGLVVALLQGLAESTRCWNPDSRASLYSPNGDFFVMIGRRSDNPIHEDSGRAVYPIREGVVGMAWREGQGAAVDLPEDEEERAKKMHSHTALPLEVGRGLKMPSRSIVGIRIMDTRTSTPIGVVVLESVQARGVNRSTIKAARDNNPVFKALQVLMSTSQELLPNLGEADRRGF